VAGQADAAERSAEAQKRSAREAVRARRAAMSLEQRIEAAAGLTARLAQLVADRGARSVSCYLPLGDEPDTRPFLAWAREQGLEVLLPSAGEDGLLDWVRDGEEGYVAGRFGILEPIGERLGQAAAAGVDLMLIPACSVGRDGMRLGWGRGYFDRCLGTMDRRPPVFAVVYDAELVDAVPSEPHDVPVTGIVTPERTVIAAPR
jgi:5-formyltetrahydrofolate cyclo-ligase